MESSNSRSRAAKSRSANSTLTGGSEMGVNLNKMWPVRKVITISGHQKPQDDEVRDRLHRRGWTLGGRTNNIARAIQEISERRASILIVEDAPNLPLQVILRQLLSSQLALLTPTLVIPNSNNTGEVQCYGSMGVPEICEPPISPSRIVESFEFMILKWSQDDLYTLYRAGLEFRAGKKQEAIKILTDLVNDPATETRTHGIAAPALSLFFYESNKKTAEKILLNSLSRSKRNMGVMLSLVSLYLNCAMPNYALRLLKNASAAYNEPKTLIPDLIQTYLMLNQIDQIPRYLRRMIKEKYMPDLAQTLLPRVLYAEGMRQEFEYSLGSSPTKIKLYDESWGQESKTQVAS